MKTIFKSIAIATVISSPLVLTDCSNSKKASMGEETGGQSAPDSTIQKAICPMHPDVTGQIGDTCPKCGMKLEAVKDESMSNMNAYYMDFKAVPEVRADEASTLTLTPSLEGTTETVALELQHDKKIHLIVVSKDLSYFDHVHPEPQSDGTYRILVLAKKTAYSRGKFHDETKFARGGDFILFADYLPTGASHQLERIELKVAGEALRAEKYTTERLVSEAGGYEVSLVTEGKFFSEGSTQMAAIIRKDGREIPADQLEDFLAAKAHMVMISQDSEHYLHVHPEVDKGRLSLHTSFGRPGIFRGWLQFKTDGKVHTADFVVSVAEGKAPQHGKETHKH
jgi:hypothetical protein